MQCWSMAVVCVLVAGGLQAQTCATKDDLSQLGIRVKQQGGVVYDVKLAPLDPSREVASLVEGAVSDLWRQNVDYVNGFHVDRANEKVARLIAPVETAAVAEGSRLSVELSAPVGVMPVAGQVWTGKLVAQLRGQDAATNREVTAAPVEVDASYHFLAETDGEIGGCHYRAIPVEFDASYGGKPLLQRRSLHFPDLQITVMTI